MEKLESRTYKGIDYIKLTELPDEQYLAFMEWVGKESIITIQVNGNSVKNCVQYTDYNYWFDSVLLKSIDKNTPDNSRRNGKSYGLAFDN